MTTESNLPLVTVVCLCYNHEKFVKNAIVSVLDQSYPNVELIVVDDRSTDNSVAVIKEVLKDHPEIKFIQHTENKGNCKSFNEGWRLGKGEFFIDLAADDVLPRERIEIGVKGFRDRDASYGVQYGNARYIYEDGREILNEFRQSPPEGDIYINLIVRYFVPSATLLIRRNVLDKLEGFDESLAYEDFDFLIRASRYFKFFYTNAELVHKRIVKGSMSEKQFEKGNPQQLSTYKVCEKILGLNKTAEEDRALKSRVWYEIRQSLRRLDFYLTKKYMTLLGKINKRNQ